MKTIAITELTEIEAIIRKCPYCTVGITDLEGNPYACLLYTSDAADEL